MYRYFVANRSRRIWFTNIVVCQIGEHVLGLYKSMTFILDIKWHKRIRKNSDSISSNLFQIGLLNLLLFDIAEHCLNSNLSWHIGLIHMTLIYWCLTGKYVIIHWFQHPVKSRQSIPSYRPCWLITTRMPAQSGTLLRPWKFILM